MPNKGKTILLGTAVSLIAKYGCAAESKADARRTTKRVRERIQYTFKANYTWEEREPLIEAWISGIKPTRTRRIPTNEPLRAAELMTWAATQWKALFQHAPALKERHGIELLPYTSSLSARFPLLEMKGVAVQIPQDRAELKKGFVDAHGELARERRAREAERAKNEALVLENADLKKQLRQAEAKASRPRAGRPRRPRSA